MRSSPPPSTPTAATAGACPVVGETWDGFLNDINGFHVKPEHVASALAAASDESVEEGSVGGGTGMVCHGFKGGIGTASRVVEDGWMVGVLVQANHGRRPRLRVNGVPVGERIGLEVVPLPESGADEGAGSIIVVIATDAPLLPGSASGSRAGPPSGSRGRAAWASARAATSRSASRPGTATSRPPEAELPLRMLNDTRIDPLYEATIDAVEESILNAMLAAETMTGYRGNTVHALPQELLLEALSR